MAGGVRLGTYDCKSVLHHVRWLYLLVDHPHVTPDLDVGLLRHRISLEILLIPHVGLGVVIFL